MNITAALGPTNTGKTHLAIERMCAHSSGAMGFPLRLLAREVYDRVVKIKGEGQVALITGEERIVPANARYFCCTAEAMPRKLQAGDSDVAFVAIDEAQLGAHADRGHIFTDHLLHTRGREETMILGSATLEPLVRALVPEAEIIERPRFSTLSYMGVKKLSRLPPRSAIVAFSAEQIYAIAEMLRRFRGGSAVVMGALSPETRNRQVAMYQAGEVDYIVASDAIGMGLNLDIEHVAFASLSKFDGKRRRRLMPAEMAQIAGRAGRHQKDGTFGTLSQLLDESGVGGAPSELTEEEVYAIENHRFKPLTKLFWREADLCYSSVTDLLEDLARISGNPLLVSADEALDHSVLKRLHELGVTENVKGARMVRRFWDVCSLPDFRALGAEQHARFVARIWQDLAAGYIGSEFAAARIAELNNMQGDIHALQGRIAAIRTWAYICQRDDWVLARHEMASRARDIEARLSDALHARLTERFVNKRTTILMKSLGSDTAMLPVSLAENGALLVDDEPIGKVTGLGFSIDGSTALADRKLLLSAAEKALPGLLAERVDALIAAGFEGVSIARGALVWDGWKLADLEPGKSALAPKLSFTPDCRYLSPQTRDTLAAALSTWLAEKLAPLAPLAEIEAAATNPEAGSWARALLLNLIAGHGYISRERAGIEQLPKEMRPFLRKIGVKFGALDIFVPTLLKPAPRVLLHALGIDRRGLQENMAPVIMGDKRLPSGYRPAGEQAVRIDIAEKLLRDAHDVRGKVLAAAKDKRQRFQIPTALAISTGLTEDNFLRLLGSAGFRAFTPRALAEGAFGPPAPLMFDWRPRAVQERQRENRKAQDKGQHKGKQAAKNLTPRDNTAKRQSEAKKSAEPKADNAFAQLAGMFNS